MSLIEWLTLAWANRTPVAKRRGTVYCVYKCGSVPSHENRKLAHMLFILSRKSQDARTGNCFISDYHHGERLIPELHAYIIVCDHCTLPACIIPFHEFFIIIRTFSKNFIKRRIILCRKAKLRLDLELGMLISRPCIFSSSIKDSSVHFPVLESQLGYFVPFSVRALLLTTSLISISLTFSLLCSTPLACVSVSPLNCGNPLCLLPADDDTHLLSSFLMEVLCKPPFLDSQSLPSMNI